MSTDEYDGAAPQLRVFLPGCVKLTAKISYHTSGWEDYINKPQKIADYWCPIQYMKVAKILEEIK